MQKTILFTTSLLIWTLPGFGYALTISVDPAVAKIKAQGLFRHEAIVTVINPEDATLRYEAKAPQGIKISPASFTLTPHETQKLTISGKPQTDDAVIRILAREGDTPGVPIQAQLHLPVRLTESSSLFNANPLLLAFIGAVLTTITVILLRRIRSFSPT